MQNVRVHPIQQNFRHVGKTVVCGMCGTTSTPRHSTTPPRVTHLVHLVREHLADVERANSTAGLAEEITVEITE